MNRIIEALEEVYADYEKKDQIIAYYEVFLMCAGVLSAAIPPKLLMKSVLLASDMMNSTIAFLEEYKNKISEDELEEIIVESWMAEGFKFLDIDKYRH